MKVSILTDLTPDSVDQMIDIMYVAARTCYSSDTTEELMTDAANYKDREQKITLLKKVLASGHHSILEHVNITFTIDGISRACSHQLVRHRLCTYSQQSQRYTTLEDGSFEYITPPAVFSKPELFSEYQKLMCTIGEFYDKALKAGVRAEDARYVLPNAAATNVTVTTNLRNLIHILGLRCCTRAQWEIRAAYSELYFKLRTVFPWMENYLGANCEQLGYCPEGQSCGKAPKISDLKAIAKSFYAETKI